MRLTFARTLLLIPIGLLACGDSGGNETGTTEPGLTTPDPSTGPASSGGLTEPTGSTGAPLTTGDGSTGEPTTTGQSTGEPGPATTTGGDTSTGGSTGPVTATDGSSDESGPPPPVGVCVTDADCALHDDCCDCYGLPAGQEDAICKKLCEQTACELLAIDQAVCRFGVCTTERVACDPTKVLCDSLPPECPKGQVAGVTGGCWSGQCVPAISCDVVPDCEVCPAGTMCVQKISKQQSLPTCEPIPAECGGEVDCDCAGGFVCTGDFDACNDLGDDLACACPVC